MTPDPLPVALPELPTPAWARDIHGETEVFTAAEMRSYATLVAEAALRAQEAEVLSLLRDAEAALRDLGACPDAECSVSQCLHILPRIRAHLAASKQEKPHG